MATVNATTSDSVQQNNRRQHHRHNPNRRHRANQSFRREDTKGKAPESQPTEEEVSEVQISEVEPAKEETEDVEVCFICAEPIVNYAVGECNHRTCHLCSLRLRALYKTNNCAYCKTSLGTVIFTHSPDRHFESYLDNGKPSLPFADHKLKIFFEDKQMYEDTMLLLRYNCPDPSCDVACDAGWGELKRHVRSVHQKVLCDLCIRNKKIFSHEHTLFTQAQLTKHYKFGDDNKGDPSGFKGHPECAFCRISFYGDDELFEHCRDRHEECHLCIRAGIRHQYYDNYNSLERHFKKDHYLCLQQECLEKKFVVFGSDIDLKAHMAEIHSNSIPGHYQRAKQREARRIEVNFSVAGTGGNNERRSRDQREQHQQDHHQQQQQQQQNRHAKIEQTVIQAETQTQSQQAHEGTNVEFPSLGKPSLTKGNQQNTSKKAKSKPPPEANDDPPSTELTTNLQPKRGIAARAPANFGLLTTPEDDSPVATFPGTSSPRNKSPMSKSKAVDPEIAKQHHELLERINTYLQNDQNRVQRFRQLTSAYRNSLLQVEQYIDSLLQLFSGEVNTTDKVLSGVIELLDDEEKKEDILTFWADRKAEKLQFPSLEVSSVTPPKSAPRVLVIKSASTRAGGARPRSSNSVWNKVALAASSPGSVVNTSFPALPQPPVSTNNGTSTTTTAWSTSGPRPEFVGSSPASVSMNTANIVKKGRGPREEDFPSLPAAPPKGPPKPVAGKQPQAPTWVTNQGIGKEDEWEDYNLIEEEPMEKVKKGKKKKQVLFRVGGFAA